jgi:ferredoxin
MGPRERGDQPGFYLFDWIEDAQELVLEYGTTTLPPKKAFFAPAETLFSFTSEASPELACERDEYPFVLIGVHPCDLAAIEALDEAYAQPPADARWFANRRRAALIGTDCLPDEYCFCTSLGTDQARGACDLFMTRVARGYLVEVRTPLGEKLIRNTRTEPPGKSDWRDREDWQGRKAESTAAQLSASPSRLARVLESGGLVAVWREVAERCYGCGSCNTTCPTCFCFDMLDEFDLSLRRGTRKRTWDSCQLLEFALVAGRHNFRAQRWQRVKHRWHRKFLYLYRQFGRPYCTGCGRCSRACTADINIVDVTNRLIEEGDGNAG